MGIDPASCELLNEEENTAKEGILILKPNVVAFDLFSSCAQQWQTIISPLGHVIRIGLRWPDVEARAKRLASYRRLSDTEQDRVWRDITIMQNAALDTFAEQRR